MRVGVEELEVAALVAHHDDPTREYAHNDHKIITDAAEHGWTVLIMRHVFTDLWSHQPCGDAP